MAAQAVSQASLGNCMLSTTMAPTGFPSRLSFSESLSLKGIENKIHSTAMWLSSAIDIINAIPSKNSVGVENELQIISRLIEEAPSVLPAVNDVQRSNDTQCSQPCFSGTASAKRKQSSDCIEASLDTNPMKLLASISSHAVPVPIAQYQTSEKSQPFNRSVSTEDLADVHTFVQFLKSVS